MSFALKQSQNIVVLTGAGISAESGIATFRAADGLWENNRIEDVASPDAFKRNPTVVYQFYNLRRQQLLSQEIMPNMAHIALANYQRQTKNKLTIITQNIDNLHERAGSENVLHMHGELLKSRCVYSDKIYQCNADLTLEDRCSCCQPQAALRPHVVWFGEQPLYLPEIELALQQADVFIAIGTSGNVYPAAGFVNLAKQMGITTVEVNIEPGDNADLFDVSLIGKASEVVPLLFQRDTVSQQSRN
ncbi:NAD-dependent protein deacylase [Neptunicella marina]|uniref:NAD-dependent protein deacylase n=2 Tax=Neptunicella marina TaxID=2125989 RepID=A0A8J6IT30_9ALTE|nr:NAD-dependent protein deacylase [Neptunicella marina]